MKAKILATIFVLLLIGGCSLFVSNKLLTPIDKHPCLSVAEEQVYDVLQELQDSVQFEDEKYAEKMEASWEVVAEYYNLTVAEVGNIIFKDIDCMTRGG